MRFSLVLLAASLALVQMAACAPRGHDWDLNRSPPASPRGSLDLNRPGGSSPASSHHSSGPSSRHTSPASNTHSSPARSRSPSPEGQGNGQVDFSVWNSLPGRHRTVDYTIQRGSDPRNPRVTETRRQDRKNMPLNYRNEVPTTGRRVRNAGLREQPNYDNIPTLDSSAGPSHGGTSKYDFGGKGKGKKH